MDSLDSIQVVQASPCVQIEMKLGKQTITTTTRAVKLRADRRCGDTTKRLLLLGSDGACEGRYQIASEGAHAIVGGPLFPCS